MSDTSKEVMLTRVTVPIDYKDPGLLHVIETTREKLEKSRTPEKRILQELNQIVDNWKGKPSAYTIAFMGNALLSHSAQKIYLIDLSNQPNESVISDLPDLLKPRIEWVDRNHKISNSISDMLEPIGNDLDKVWKKVREKNGADIHDFNGHEHALCLLIEFLVTLVIATKNNTEADVDVNIITKGIKRIIKQVESQESKILISRIEGILNCYRISRLVPNLSPVAQIGPSDLLKDLFDDSSIINLEKILSRYP